jgi:uncharacterized protein (DUF1330 family)
MAQTRLLVTVLAAMVLGFLAGQVHGVRAAAQTPAQSAGSKGTYALDGNLTIEKYRSMDELLKFWNSPGYRDAQKLRAPLNNINFIVAIEGR